MKKNIFQYIIITTLTFTASFSFAQSDALTLEDGVMANESIDSLYQQFSNAYSDLDTSQFKSIYAQDAYYLQPKAHHFKGIDALIENGFAGWFGWMKEGNGTLSISFRIIERELQENLGYDIGYYKVIQKRPEEEDEISEGKFVVVTKKQDNGEWRFQVDAYNDIE